MHADELIIKLRLHELHARLKQLGPDSQYHEAAHHEHDERKDQIHGADIFMVRRRKPTHDARWMIMMLVMMRCS